MSYIERLGKQLRATSKGRQAISLLGDHALTSADLTGRWEKRLSDIEHGAGARAAFMDDIRAFTSEVVEYFRDLSSDDVRALREEIGPCPNCDGTIRENRLAYGCSSWKSREEPGCGFVIWKQQKGRSISAAEARELLEKGQTELLDGFKTRPSRARLVLAEGNQVQLIADDGTRLDAPAGPREKIADCPKCDGEIRENSRAYGCSSWKSKKEPGCGFVIWKSTKGRQIRRRGAPGDRERRLGLDGLKIARARSARQARPDARPDGRGAREDEGTEAATQAPDRRASPCDRHRRGGVHRLARGRRPLARGDAVVVVDNLSSGREARVPAGADLRRIDIRDGAALKELAADVEPEAWFHLAAQADVRVSVADPGFDADVNVRGTAEVLEAARTTGARVVFSSTGGAIYGEVDQIPSPESTPCAAMAPYGISKLCGEHYVELSNRLYGTNHIILRYGNVYGPRQDPHGEAGSSRSSSAGWPPADAARLRRRPPDARLRLRRRRRPRQPRGTRLRRLRADVQHRDGDRDQRPRALAACQHAAGTAVAPEHRTARLGSSPEARLDATGRSGELGWRARSASRGPPADAADLRG